MLVVSHHQAARIARRLMDVTDGPASPSTLDAAFDRLRERLETKDVAIGHVKEVALKSLVRAKAQIDVERDPV